MNEEILSNSSKPEYIICAAIWFNDEQEHLYQPKNIESGFVICGRRHHNCFNTLGILNKMVKYKEEKQGFLTSKDRFIDRKESGELAFKVKQIDRYTDCLFSEDLY